MALYRFLFAPVLLAVAVLTSSGPSDAQPSEPRPPASSPAASPAAPAVPAALHGAAAARPVRAR